jgi:hypothetical protein
MDRDSFINKFIADDIKTDKHLKSSSLKCVFPCCNERAIHSHTISKEDALRSIAKDGKVLTFKPVIKDRTHVLEPQYIGIGDATTFRGFCKKHDDIFERIDHGLYETEYDLALQLLRCIGWWKSMEIERTHLVNEHKKTILTHENEIYEKLGLPKQSECVNSYDSGLSVTNEMYMDLATAVENDKDQLEQNTISGRKILRLGKWTILYVHLRYQIPLALSSRHPFRLGEDVFCIHWIVVPHSNTTDIIVFLDADGINRYIEANCVENNWLYRMSSNLAILETVEAAMASSEFWFINPDVYEGLSDRKKENLQFDVRYKCIVSPVWESINYTIFDKLWVEFIKKETNQDIIKAANEKMSFIPQKLTQEDWDQAESILSRSMFEVYHY